MLLVESNEIACQLPDSFALARIVLEKLSMGVLHVRRDLGHLMGPLGEDFLCRLVKEADLCVGFALLGALTARLQVVACLMERTKRVSDVLRGLSCNAEVLSQPAHLLVQVDVALFCLDRYFGDFLIELGTNLVHLIHA